MTLPESPQPPAGKIIPLGRLPVDNPVIIAVNLLRNIPRRELEQVLRMVNQALALGDVGEEMIPPEGDDGA